MDRIHVFTDGACKNNGGDNSVAGYGVYWPNHEYADICQRIQESRLTNNRAELMAVDAAFAVCVSTNASLPIVVYTDSKLIVNTFGSSTKQGWVSKWSSVGWKKSNGDQVLNVDLIQSIYDKSTKLKYEFVHVRAHTRNNDYLSKGNREADRLANVACR